MASGDNDTTTVKDTTATKVEDTKAVAKTAEPKFKLKKDADKKVDVKTTPDSQLEAAKKLHPLLAMLQVTGPQSLSTVGYASVRDTAAINKIIYSAMAKQVLPTDLKLLWGAKPADVSAKNIYELHALKITQSNGQAPLQGDVVVDASDEFNHLTGQPEVNMKMNSEGARRWAELTKANIGKAIAIVLDGVVYSAPRCEQRDRRRFVVHQR
jgi:SecD/SecF fusion protein